MTTKTISEMIEVMQAFLDGKDVEVRAVIGKTWCSCSRPDWNWNQDYRVKQEPREWWDISPSPYHFSTEEAAKHWIARSCDQIGCKVIHVREVIGE